MREQKIDQKKAFLILGLIVVLSILAKLTLFYFLIYHHIPHGYFVPNTSEFVSRISYADTFKYVFPAKSFLETGHFMSSAHQYMMVRTPGYPIFIAGVFSLFGYHLFMVVITQIFLSAMFIICAYFIGTKLVSASVGLWAAFLVSIDYLLWGYVYTVYTETLFVVYFSLMLTIAVFVFMSDKRLYLKMLLLGFFLGMAALTRPIAYFFVAPMAIGFLVYFLISQFSAKKTILALLLLILPVAILTGAWQARNKVLLDTYTFSGITSDSAHTVGQFFPKSYEQYQQLIKGKIGKREAHLSLVDDLHILALSPGYTAETILAGIPKILLSSDVPLIRVFGTFDDFSAVRQIKHEFMHLNFSAMARTFKQRHVHAVSVVYMFSALLVNAALWALIVFGIFMLFKRKLITQSKRHLFAHILFLGVVAYFLLLSANGTANARYRVPFELILDFYAAVGLVMFCRLFKPK